MKSLLHQKVLITREQSQANEFAELVKRYSGIPIIVPMLTIEPFYHDHNKKVFDTIEKFDWIFFTSSNGVHHFFKQLNDIRRLNHCRFAIVGHKTEQALKSYGFKAHFIPSIYNAETMATEFLQKYKQIKNVLFVRGNISRQTLLREFMKQNIPFAKVVVYETRRNDACKEKLNKVVREGIDCLTFTSPSTVESFVKLMDDEQLLNSIRSKHCICIGTTTEKAAIKHQFKNTYIPDVFTIEGMVEKMIEVVQMEENK